MTDNGKASDDGWAYLLCLIGFVCFFRVKDKQFLAFVGLILFLVGCL